MRRISDSFLVLPAAVALAGFAIGIFLLLDIPFGAGGGVYPAYSTFRGDPLGAEVLYKALDKLPHVTARRNLGPLLNLPDGRDRTLFLLDVSKWAAAPEDEMDAIRRFVLTGGRLVISSAARNRRSFRTSSTESKSEKQEKGEAEKSRSEQSQVEKSGAKPPKKKKSTAPRRKCGSDRCMYVRKLFTAFGIEVVFSKTTGTTEAMVDAVRVSSPADSGSRELPAKLPWHSRIFFKPLDTAWRTVYAVKEHPVVLERRSGSGSVVVLGESYLLSNEALQRDRHTGFLAWIAGTGREMIFDEEHLGVSESMGVAKLLRRAGLHGLLAGLLFLGLLWLWREAVPFLPRTPHPDSPFVHSAGLDGKDAVRGLENLLRRGIPMHELPTVCLDEWVKSLPGQRKPVEAIDRARRLVTAASDGPRSERDPVATYNLLSQVLGEPRIRPVSNADASAGAASASS